ncbi:MAG: helix-turn-helix transcriptional regulator [Eggerthellaceae bacterium]|nr:helix-turn-helix transcriptional regulator [Eggerthellaceae bacterium]
MEVAIFICVLANLVVSIAVLVELRSSRRGRSEKPSGTGISSPIDAISTATESECSLVQALEPIDDEELSDGSGDDHVTSGGIDPLAAACSVLAVEHGLTNRESEVLIQLARGYNCRSIADLLTISEATVKSHSLKVYRKLGVHSQQELITLVQSQ